MTFLTTSIRRCGSNGLTSQPLAPAARPFDLHFVRRFGGEHQDRHLLVGRQAAQRLDQGEAVHLRHVLVGQDQVDGLQLRLVQAILAVDRFHHLVAGGLQAERHHLAQGTGIVDRENCFSLFFLLCS
jgi:hypothetical protein